MPYNPATYIEAFPLNGINVPAFTIVRSYKSAVAYRINLMRGIKGIPVWHGNYYERIIRSHEDWDRIHNYIESNPSKWAEDEENL